MQLHRFLFTASLTCTSRVVQIRDRLLGRIPRDAAGVRRNIRSATHHPKRQKPAGCSIRQANYRPSASGGADLSRHRRNRLAMVSDPADLRRGRHRLAGLRLLRLWPQHRLHRLDANASRMPFLHSNSFDVSRPGCPFLCSDFHSEPESRPPSSAKWPPIASYSAVDSLPFATPHAPHGSPDFFLLSSHPSGSAADALRELLSADSDRAGRPGPPLPFADGSRPPRMHQWPRRPACPARPFSQRSVLPTDAGVLGPHHLLASQGAA